MHVEAHVGYYFKKENKISIVLGTLLGNSYT